MRFHWVENVVEPGGSPRLVGVMLAEDKDGNLFYNINADVEGWRTKKGDPSNLPAVSNAGESGSPIRAEAAASPVSSTMAEEGAGVNPHARARQRGQLFPIKKPRVASSVSRVFRNEDTSRGIDISHPAGDNGASHKTGFSLSDAVVPVNDTALSGQTETAPTSS